MNSVVVKNLQTLRKVPKPENIIVAEITVRPPRYFDCRTMVLGADTQEGKKLTLETIKSLRSRNHTVHVEILERPAVRYRL